jgi:large subunit ribosomal protein L22
MRLIADLIRGKKVTFALNLLKFQPQHGAIKMEKLLFSAVANWLQKNPDASIEDADLYVKTVMVDEGRMLKRLRPAPQGRAHRVRKRSNHITIVVDEKVSLGIESLTELSN